MKNRKKIKDELFDAVVDEIRKMVLRPNADGSIGMSGFILDMSNWRWESKKNFLLTKKSDKYMSFAKTVDSKHYRDRLPERLKSMVDVMLGSSTLEEMKIKFTVAGLLGEKPAEAPRIIKAHGGKSEEAENGLPDTQERRACGDGAYARGGGRALPRIRRRRNQDHRRKGLT